MQRQLKHDLNYESSLKDQEVRNLDRKEDEVVVKENELRRAVMDAAIANGHNQTLKDTKVRLEKAMSSTNELVGDAEERLEKASEELGLTEVDVIMLQRTVKVAEEETRKWKQRYMMVKKDLQRAEKLMRDFSKSKEVELKLKKTSAQPKVVRGRMDASKGRLLKKDKKALGGLSHLARSFGGIDVLAKDDLNSSDFMKAVLGMSSAPSRQALTTTSNESHDSNYNNPMRRNRMGTAKARSIARRPELWAETLMD